MGETLERFPLFPLGMVLLPSEVIPLHIFEERYKTMIEECLDQHSEFGIIWLSDDGLRGIGCAATVTRLIERLDDGRLNILVEGSRPFRLLRRIDDLPYPAGDVEMLDEPEDESVDDAVASAARRRYADLVARVTDTRPPDSELEDMSAYRMASTVEFGLDTKQQLLEARSEEERLRLVAELFGSTMKRLDYAEQAGEVARSNGKVHLPG